MCTNAVIRVHSKRLVSAIDPCALLYSSEQIELVQFDMSWLNRAAQYRWFQVAYQLGVFISRSSVAFIRLPFPWTYVVLQVL